MAYFAQVDKNEMVVKVIVADQEFIDSGVAGEPDSFIECWRGGGKRKHFPGRGYHYRRIDDVFVPPKPYESWILDKKWHWVAPVAIPLVGKYFIWNEDFTRWDIDTR